MKLECGVKTGLFVHNKIQRRNVFDEIWDKVEEGQGILHHEYADNNLFKNKATHIDPELLEYYFDNYCGSH